jgi:hypothetical protein
LGDGGSWGTLDTWGKSAPTSRPADGRFNQLLFRERFRIELAVRRPSVVPPLILFKLTIKG